ncbi:o-succinylbenzoate synthase [Candidatus Zixiibacteriota bacterium]
MIISTSLDARCFNIVLSGHHQHQQRGAIVYVEQIIMREIPLKLKEPFRISSGTTFERRILLLEITDENGTAAWSECVAGEQPNYSSETIDTAWLMIGEHAAPRVLGREIGHPSEVWSLLEKEFRGHKMAKAAVEMGLWELYARRENVALSRLIGGERPSVETGISIGIQSSPAELVEEVTARLEEGYRKIKVKIMPGSDLEYLSALRQAFGPDIPLMVDANCAYSFKDIDRLTALDRLGLMMIEQPLGRDDLLQHARLQNMLITPICLDESITGPDRVRDMLEMGSGRIVNIKPGRVGGFGPSIAIHNLCLDAGIPIWCGGMLESGIGRGYNLALASLPGFTLPGDLSPSARYWERDIVTPEWTMEHDGMVILPLDQPGTGVAVDSQFVESLTLRSAVLTPG